MLKIILASGQVQEVPFDQTSTLTVTNQGFVDGVPTPVTASFSEIEDLEITADPAPDVAEIHTEDPLPPPAPTGSVPVDTGAVGPEPTSSGVDPTETGTSNAFATADNTTAGQDATNPVVTSATASSGLDGVATSDTPEPTDEAAQPPEPDTSNPQVDELSQGIAPQSVGEALSQADAAGTTVVEPTDGSPAQDGSTQVDQEGNPSVAPLPTPDVSLTDTIAQASGVVDAAANDPAAHIDHLAQAQTDVTVALNTWPDDPNLLDLKQQLDDLAADASEASAS